jgi:hypothetical protein
LPGVKDGDAVCQLARDPEVVGDEQHRHAKLVAKPAQQRQYLRLDGDVERRGRLIGDDELGGPGNGYRDHDALAQPSRKLVGERAKAVTSVRHSDRL